MKNQLDMEDLFFKKIKRSFKKVTKKISKPVSKVVNTVVSKAKGLVKAGMSTAEKAAFLAQAATIGVTPVTAQEEQEY